MADSLQSIDKRCVFRETFESEQSVRKNGGIPTAVTFDKGVGNFIAPVFLSKIIYPPIYSNTNTTCSIRVKLKITTLSHLNIIASFQDSVGLGSGACYINTSGVIESTGGTSYMNGNSSYTIPINTLVDLVISGIGIRSKAVRIGMWFDETSYGFDGSFELFEIYSGTLTAEEVKNLYENKRHKEFNPNHGEQLGVEKVVNGDFSSSSGWTIQTGWSIVDGKAVGTNVNGFSSLQQLPSLISGNLYKIQLTVSDYVSGQLYAYVGNAGFTSPITANGSYTFYRINEGAPVNEIDLRGDGNFTGKVDNFSIKEVLVNSTKEILNVSAFDGTIRNKYSGEAYNEFCVNGGFDTDTDWTKSTGWTINNGLLNINAVATTSANQFILTIGKTYRVTFTITSYVSGNIIPYCGNAGQGTSRLSAGIFTEDIICAGNTIMYLYTSIGFIGTIDNISVKEVIPSVIPTAVEVVKDGDVYAMKFNSSISKISVGSYDTLVGDISVSGWFNAKSLGESNIGILINNGQFIVGVNATNNRISVTSDNSTTVYSGNNVVDFNDNVHIGVSRTSTGVVNIYINGVLSGTANQASGTPVAGGDITIGNNTGQSATWNGLIQQMKVISGILTAQEFAQEYSSSKARYGL